MKKLLAGAAVALASLASSAQADGHANYPERPIMLMVSYGAGGHRDDTRLEICGAAGTIADHQHDGPFRVVCMAIGLHGAGQAGKGNGCTCE